MDCRTGRESRRGRAESGSPRASCGPGPVRPPPYLHEHMFPTLTTRRPRNRSLRERVREAVGTALEFATLGEATLGPAAPQAPVPQPAPADTFRAVHRPHHRAPAPPPAGSSATSRRSGSVRPRAQVCSTPVSRSGTGADLNRAAPRSGRTGAPDGLQRLSGRRGPGQAASAVGATNRNHAAEGGVTTEPAPIDEDGAAQGGSVRRNRRRPTLPGPCGPSTIGAERLNCSVRNGKRCFPLAIATGNC